VSPPAGSFAIHLFAFGVPVALVVRAMQGPRRDPVMI
jgi:hypothetical protein